MICRRKTDNRTTFWPARSGWTFRNDGTLLKVKDPDGAGYPDTFNSGGSHNMTKSRASTVTGSSVRQLNPDVLPLARHLETPPP